MTVSVWLFLFSVFSRSPVLCSMCHRIHITLKIALFIEIVVSLVFSRAFSLCINYVITGFIYTFDYKYFLLQVDFLPIL